MENTTNESWLHAEKKTFNLRLCLNCRGDLEKRLFGRELNTERIERHFHDVKTGRYFLSWSHLRMLKTSPDWIFTDFWVMPSRWELRKDIKKTRGIFAGLPEGEREVTGQLYHIFKNIEVVSIILRFVDPVNYGIMSPPVKYALQGRLGSGWEYTDEYIKYLSVLREYRDKYGLVRVADVSDSLWTLVEGCLRGNNGTCDNLRRFRETFLTIEESIIKEKEKENISQEEIEKLEHEIAYRRQLSLKLEQDKRKLEDTYVNDVGQLESEKEKLVADIRSNNEENARLQEQLNEKEKELLFTRERIAGMKKGKKDFHSELLFRIKESPNHPGNKFIHEPGHDVDRLQKDFMLKLACHEKIHKIIWNRNTDVKPPTRIAKVTDNGEVTIFYVAGKNNYTAEIKVYPAETSPDPTHARYFSYLVASYMDIPNNVFSKH